MGLGASAGLTLSPVPWKLLDDLSIWTQNWPWVPVPQDGAVSVHESVCSLCPGGCGVSVRRIDERVVSVAGSRDFPINRGGICPLGISGPQLLYTPVRIMSPMLRENDGFRQISWNEATALLAGRLRELRDKGQTHKLACLSDTDQGTVPLLLKRFLDVFGSPHFFHTPSAEDTWEHLSGKLTGSRFVPGYDLEGADTILSFGCSLLEGWGSPVHSMRAHSLWKEKGATLIQVEPRLSATAAAANRWIAVNPGTEADLALGICHLMVEKYPGCRQRLAAGLNNPSQFLEVLRRTGSTTQVAQATGLSGSVIESLADQFATASRPLALGGRLQGRSAGDTREFAAILVLNLLAGNIDRPGGFHRIRRQDYTRWPAVTPGDEANEGRPSNRLAETNTCPEELFQLVSRAATSPVEVLLVSGVNPCHSLMNADTVNEAVQKIPLVVSFSTHWDETAMCADLVLPNHSHLERYQDVPVYSGLKQPKLGLSKPVSRQLFDTRYTGDAVIETARLLGGTIARAFPWQNYEICLRETLQDRWQVLLDQGVIDLPEAGRFSEQGLRASDPGHFIQPAMPPEGDRQVFPLLLISKISMRLGMGAAGSAPFMVKSVEDTVLSKKISVVDIHPDTAGSMGLDEGVTARLTTPYAKAEVMIHLDEGTMPGLVVISQGLGHTAFDAYLADKGVNPNRLLGPVKDPVTGQNTAWGIHANLSRV